MGQDGVAALRRNGWPESIGISGRFRPESVAGFVRNTHPSEMGLGETVRVFMTVSRNLSENEILKTFPQEYILEGKKIKTSDVMHGNLEAMEFELKAETSAKQSILPRGTTQWSWMIKPKKAGDNDITFSLSSLAQIDDSPVSIFLQTYTQTIKVSVSGIDGIFAYLKDNHMVLYPLFGGICGLIGIIIGRKIRK